jgi:glycosyltransferase involved in cell wall biosynthesis
MSNKIMNKRILFLSDVNSAHTRKWAESLAKKGFEIGVFSLSPCKSDWFEAFTNITIFSSVKLTPEQFIASDLSKVAYFKELRALKEIIKTFKPDIVHAHYATSYGLLGVLTKFKPLIISLWGSDIFDFPRKSILHRAVLKYNLKMADRVLSTSYVMAEETKKYTDRPVTVTPFGIDMDLFKPEKVESLFAPNDIVIGTIKVLDEVYGIDYLIKAFKILRDKHPELPLKLLIVGRGQQAEELKQLTVDLGVSADCIFTGFVNHSLVPHYHNMICIPCFLSNSESFGVAVLEASSCEKPVVVTNVGGLPEVVDEGVTGFIVPPRDEKAAADAIDKLISSASLRETFGKNGRKKVNQLYDWNKNLEDIIEIYNDVLNNAN